MAQRSHHNWRGQFQVFRKLRGVVLNLQFKLILMSEDKEINQQKYSNLDFELNII